MSSHAPASQGPGPGAPGQHRPAVLVTAASRYGSTAEIACAIRDELIRLGLDAVEIAPAEMSSVSGYDAVVLGSAVYVGHWLGPARDLAARCRDDLRARPVWLFSSGPVGNPAGKLARSMKADPVDLAAVRADTGARGHQIFAGKLDRKRLSVAQRAALLIFRGLAGDFRDWPAIRRWAGEIAGELAGAARR